MNLLTLALFMANLATINSSNSLKSLQKKYPYLSRRALLEPQKDLLINFLGLRENLRKETAPWGDSFGLYFEYLPTGSSIGINSGNEFYAASLFKVPVVMAYYHELERTGGGEKELIIESRDLDKHFGNLWKKGKGIKIKASEAVTLTLEDSDNTAAKLIARQVDKEDFDAVYQSLDIDLRTGSGGAILTTKNYSSILKALYFSAVLNRDDSNKILNFLTMSKFDNKIVAGVPKGVSVAHKIGDFRDSKNKKTYMDCGIVYVPKRPYSVCMLSVGDEKTANERMAKASKTIYNYVSSVK